MTQSLSASRPVLAPAGWNGTKPTVTFTNDFLRYDTWSGAPNGKKGAQFMLAQTAKAMGAARCMAQSKPLARGAPAPRV